MLLDELVRQCPRCKKSFVRIELMSYSQFGKSELRSDGRDMSMQTSEISFLPFFKCPHCRQLIWAENSEVIQTAEEDFDNLPRVDYPPSDYWPDIQKHLCRDADYLLKQDLPDGRELFVHLLIWRTINDYRYLAGQSLRRLNFWQFWHNRKKYYNLRKDKQNHIKQILQLLKKVQSSENPQFDNMEEILLEIELLRESRQFSKAEHLLKEKQKELQSYTEFVKKSKKAIALRSSSVFKIY